jgi:phospholipase C
MKLVTLFAASVVALFPMRPAMSQSRPSYPIKHVIVIMQENRSFDTYFGTFPGANGFPSNTCVPLDPTQPSLGCVVPFHDKHDANAGGPHTYKDAFVDLDDGITANNMDGYIYQQTTRSSVCFKGVGPAAVRPEGCGGGVVPGVLRHDVVGYHTATEIPNYWEYAKQFVLQDQLFSGDRSWSLDAHIEMVSEWSARCDKTSDLSSCKSSLDPRPPSPDTPVYPWVNLFQLMDVNNVSWKYYLGNGDEPDCADGEMTCEPQHQGNSVLSIWNPAPGFAWVQAKGADYLAAHNPDVDQFLLDVQNGTLPQVSWIIPNGKNSEHPPSGVTAGMEFVTSLVNAVMQSPYWQDTAIFIAWDDWGGFYDHVAPPNVDWNDTVSEVQGFGIRVPGLLVSAYARHGMIDHQLLSFDSYATFIEKLFMNGMHLDPVQLGQPDRRPDIRDALAQITFNDSTVQNMGDLLQEFNFKQPPRAPVILSTHIPVDIKATCGSTNKFNQELCTSSTVKIAWDKISTGTEPSNFTYYVERDGLNQPVCTSTKTSCTDNPPKSGAHFYRVYSVDSSGVASPRSAAAEADTP